jgi:hypothetical protein
MAELIGTTLHRLRIRTREHLFVQCVPQCDLRVPFPWTLIFQISAAPLHWAGLWQVIPAGACSLLNSRDDSLPLISLRAFLHRQRRGLFNLMVHQHRLYNFILSLQSYYHDASNQAYGCKWCSFLGTSGITTANYILQSYYESAIGDIVNVFRTG